MITYKLTKKLNDAGFPVRRPVCKNPCDGACFPTLSELIEACGEGFGWLSYRKETKDWVTAKEFLDMQTMTIDSTPEEAVANLWLNLNDK